VASDEQLGGKEGPKEAFPLICSGRKTRILSRLENWK
jgi:hypothetical protein